MPLTLASETEQPEIPQTGGFTFQDQKVDEHPELVNLAKYMPDSDLDILGERCYE